jgi:hypothetical protein
MKPSLDDVLNELAALPAPPVDDELRGWTNKYPEYTGSIIGFVTDWIATEAETEAAIREIIDRAIAFHRQQRA